MKQTLFFLFALITITAFSQKKVECRKGDVTVENQKIADYDSKGGLLSTYRYIWLLSPTTKDTFLTINADYVDFANPLFQNEIFYKITFRDGKNTTYYKRNPTGWGSVGDRKIVGLFFNDKTPLLIENDKLSESAIAALGSSANFDYDHLSQAFTKIKQTIKETEKVTVERDRKQPALQQTTTEKNYIPKVHIVDPYETAQKIIITQGGVQIGAYEKESSGGNFAKCIYSFYKIVKDPLEIDGKKIIFLPVAVSEATPGITSSVTSTDIRVRLLGSDTEIKVPPAEYNMAGSLIIKALIDRGVL